jgi:DNA helicase-2/ATP-dependent DNA helicase PcrA
VTTSYVRKPKKSTMDFKDEVGIGLGQKVVHPTFGLGVVLNYEGSGESARVQINFEKAGSKWLVLALLNWRCWDEKFFNNWSGYKFTSGM